jgi:MFS family permease
MDRYGPRRLLTIASLSCVLGSFLFAATKQLWIAEIGRFLIGFGSAFAFVGVLKLATIWLPSRYFAMFSGLATALGMLGAIAGNLVLTDLVSLIGWQETIYLSGVFGIAVALLIGLFVRDQDLDRKKVVYNIDLPQVIHNLWSIMKSSQMWIAGIIGGLLYVSTSAFAELWGNPYLRVAHGFTPDQAAVAVSFIFAGWVVGGPLAGWISDTIKRRSLPLTINSLIAAALISVILFIPNLSTWDVYALLFIFGVFSGVQVTAFAIGREISSPQAAGSAIAFTNMVVMLSGVIFQPFIGYLLDFLGNGKMVNKVPVFTITDYQIALVIIPISLVISAVMSQYFLKETYCNQISVEEETVAGIPNQLGGISVATRANMLPNS